MSWFIEWCLTLLLQACLSRLMSQHLPKKEASYRRGWRFWRRIEVEYQADPASATTSATTKVSIVITNFNRELPYYLLNNLD